MGLSGALGRRLRGGAALLYSSIRERTPGAPQGPADVDYGGARAPPYGGARAVIFLNKPPEHAWKLLDEHY